MANTVTLNQSNDLIRAISSVVKNDLKGIIKQSAYEDPRALGNQITKPFISVYKYSKQQAEVTKNEGIRYASKNIARDSFATMKSIALFPKTIYVSSKYASKLCRQEFESLNSKEEKAIFLTKASIYFVSFAGGTYLGNKIPDKDIRLLGIGKHRHWTFHSVLPTIAFAMTAKFLARIFEAAEDYLDENSPDRELFIFLKRNIQFLAFGQALGSFYHLSLDATVEGSKAVVSPWGNTFVKGTLYDDRAYLFVNALLSGEVGYKDISITKGASSVA